LIASSCDGSRADSCWNSSPCKPSSVCQAALSIEITLSYWAWVKSRPSQLRSSKRGLTPKMFSVPPAVPSTRSSIHFSTRMLSP